METLLVREEDDLALLVDKTPDEKVRDALAVLADKTPDQIAAYLLEHDHRGRRSNNFQCPMAKLLESVSGKHVSVGAWRARIMDVCVVDLPEPVTDFVHRFDWGYYGTLEI